MTIRAGSVGRTSVAATHKVARRMALGCVAGAVLFTLAWFVLGFLSPGFTMFDVTIAPYSPISAQISGLGLGKTAPFMNTAFAVSGLLFLVGVIGSLRTIRELSPGARRTCTILLALTPLGIITDGLFTVESFLPHFSGAGLGFGAPVLSFLITGLHLRRVPRWRRFANWLIVASPLTLAFVVLFFSTFTPTAAGEMSGIAGLTERILVTNLCAWFAALGWLAFRKSKS